jgi:uncharacterized protein (DUF1810 family)
VSEFDLDRFVQAQEGVYPRALGELRAGCKQSHWMWFIFPQLAALGRSGTARFYGLANLDEATAYLQHPLLGPRLRECTCATLALENRTAVAIFGQVDALKFRSCLTLFARAAGEDQLFSRALARYYGDEDPRTLELLGP